jgi:hypothetical protein
VTRTDCDASRYVILSTPPLCVSRKCQYTYKINNNIPHLTCVPSDSRLYSQTVNLIASGVRQTLRVEPSASDNHTTLDVLSAFAPPLITFYLFRHVVPSIRQTRVNATRVALVSCVQSVKVLTVICPPYFFHSNHLTLFRISACVAISNNRYYIASNGRMMHK